MHTEFWLENPKRRGHSEDLGVDGRIILEWILEKCGEVVDWNYLTQDRYQWRTLLKSNEPLNFIKGG
jgi:hypothetical protein